MARTEKKSETAVRRTRVTKARPTHEEIALRAYQIYLERGKTAGNELEDWTRAERELMEKRRKTPRKVAPASQAA